MSRPKTTIIRGAAMAAAAGMLLLTPAVALGHGPPVVNQTDHVVNQTETSIGVHPCTGQPVQLTVTESGRIHFVGFADGTVHFNGTLHATFSADALPTDGTPDAAGTLTTRFGGNGLLLEEGGAIGKAETKLHRQRSRHQRRRIRLQVPCPSAHRVRLGRRAEARPLQGPLPLGEPHRSETRRGRPARRLRASGLGGG